MPATRVVMAASYLLIGLLIFVPDTILNGPAAIGSEENSVELIDDSGAVVASWSGPKSELAKRLVEWIDGRWASE